MVSKFMQHMDILLIHSFDLNQTSELTITEVQFRIDADSV